MKYTEIRYERTFNLGNYESEKIGVTSILEEGDDAGKALQEMISFIENKGKQPKSSLEVVTEKVVEMPVKKDPPVKKPAAFIEDLPEPKETPKSVVEEKKEAQSVVVEEAPEKIEEEPPVVTPPPPEPKPEAKRVSFKADPNRKGPAKKPNVKYSREIRSHKEELSTLLNLYFPDWRSNAAKAKKVSESLEGVDFLDGDNDPIPEFVELFKKLMNE